jgi:hypothetical protein
MIGPGRRRPCLLCRASTRPKSIRTICTIVHSDAKRGCFRRCQEATCTIVHLGTGGQVILRADLPSAAQPVWVENRRCLESVETGAA